MKYLSDIMYDEKDYKILVWQDNRIVYLVYSENNFSLYENERIVFEYFMDEYELYYANGGDKLVLYCISQGKLEVMYFDLKKWNCPSESIVYKSKEIDNETYIDINYDYTLSVFVWFFKKIDAISIIALNMKGIFNSFIWNNKEIMTEREIVYCDISSKKIIQGELGLAYHLYTVNGKQINANKLHVLKNSYIYIKQYEEYFEIIKVCSETLNMLNSVKIPGEYDNSIETNAQVVIVYILAGKFDIVCIDKNLKCINQIKKPKEIFGRLNIQNRVKNRIIVTEEVATEGINIFIVKDHEMIGVKKWCTHNRLDIKITEKKKYLYLGNNNPKDLIISFHGGPESFESLDFRYGELYSVLLRKYNQLGIIIYNYPGSITFGKKYKQSPWLNWGRILQDDFNKVINEMRCEFRKLKSVTFLGSSFGGTVSLQLNIDLNCSLNKILINPMYDINDYVNSIDKDFFGWFDRRFKLDNKAELTLENFYKLNKEFNLLYILGRNDTLISSKYLRNYYEQHINNNHNICIDDGGHNSNKRERMFIVLREIENILQKGEQQNDHS
ncbi:alpha/beta hydrolase [Dolosigranulum pigrum]|uniref:alpha/beta hydrolase n=1 Tax=Dolosigranulum pigrum TaxID=29394 RepID=UPI001AD859D4|nr:alpha/beta hydrolase [Dolosigranulum pigrum]QTJ35929.1 hypothetical protein FE323_02565 [Dolosigranulum pigrum]